MYVLASRKFTNWRTLNTVRFEWYFLLRTIVWMQDTILLHPNSLAFKIHQAQTSEVSSEKCGLNSRHQPPIILLLLHMMRALCAPRI